MSLLCMDIEYSKLRVLNMIFAVFEQEQLHMYMKTVTANKNLGHANLAINITACCTLCIKIELWLLGPYSYTYIRAPQGTYNTNNYIFCADEILL